MSAVCAAERHAGDRVGTEFMEECMSEFAAEGGSKLLSQSCGIHELCEVCPGVRDRFHDRIHVEFTFVKRPIMMPTQKFPSISPHICQLVIQKFHYG